MLVGFSYLAVTHFFAALRPIRRTSRDEDSEIPALRHQLTVLSDRSAGLLGLVGSRAWADPDVPVTGESPQIR
ncbi:hypothetical protein D5S17_05785 [Pseudonocardiaceae bacterium YIM PH 21723]|nr:hypothetical protein D5S17_05785 [Pseudonocardiaceae bacterium YIM PH 21723]